MRSPSKPGSVDDPTEVTLAPMRVSDEITASTPPPTPPAPTSDPDIPVGTQLGEYTVDIKLGEGGMGSVFSAMHPLIGKRAAVKVLRKKLCEDPVTLERFIDEARVVNEIGHPNIVDVFAFGMLADGRSYFVMEWLKGESLRGRLARGPVDHVEACAILKQLVRALEAVHEKGIVHRDLKPDNVFLVEERDEIPRVKLLDFGIAKLVRPDQQVSRTATGAMVGTPQYVAPEQAKGRPIDARVDIYSLGCVAFELIAGRPPFIADNPMEMVAKHLMEAPPRLSSLVPSVPHVLDQIVADMLSKEREQRPTLTEVVAALDKAQRATGGPSAATSGISVTRRLEVTTGNNMMLRRRPSWLAPVGLALIGIVAGAVTFMVISALKEEDTATHVVAPGPVVEPRPAARTSDLGPRTSDVSQPQVDAGSEAAPTQAVPPSPTPTPSSTPSSTPSPTPSRSPHSSPHAAHREALRNGSGSGSSLGRGEDGSSAPTPNKQPDLYDTRE